MICLFCWHLLAFDSKIYSLNVILFYIVNVYQNIIFISHIVFVIVLTICDQSPNSGNFSKRWLLAKFYSIQSGECSQQIYNIICSNYAISSSVQSLLYSSKHLSRISAMPWTCWFTWQPLLIWLVASPATRICVPGKTRIINEHLSISFLILLEKTMRSDIL